MRFVPSSLEPYIAAAERGETSGHTRRPAVHALVRAYTKGSRLLTGIGLWLGLVASVLVVGLALVAAVAALLDGGPLWRGLLGAAGLLAGGAAGAWTLRRGLDLLRAGGRISRAAESWMSSAPELRSTPALRAHELFSGLRPELYPRVLLCSVTLLSTLISGSLTGLATSRLASSPAEHLVLDLLLVVVATALTVCSAVPFGALWRGLRRIQRGLTRDPAAMA